MLKILFIDDDPSAIEEAKRYLESMEYSCELANFNNATKMMAEFEPQIVILDVYGGQPADLNLEGEEPFKFIWEQQFCPIIVFSADPENFIENSKINRECFSHPLVETVTKGSNDEFEIEKCINNFRSQVEILQKALTDFDERIREAMRVVSDYVFKQSSNDEEESDNDSEQSNYYNDDEIIEKIERLLKRRVAALINELLISDEPLESWEQYIIPPLSKDLLLGDVLRKKEPASMDPDNFCIVLSPSCDLVRNNGKTKINEVLVAKCCSNMQALIELNLIDENISFESFRKNRLEKFEDKLHSNILTQGYSKNFIPLPKVKDNIPSMMVDLRKLHLISLDNNKNSSNLDTIDTFIRVASLDSPFRELIAWAYQQIACRPGLPERNFSSWSEEIKETLTNQGT